jgi:hypothetical protein
MIQPGIDNSDHPIGLVSCSEDSFSVFDEIFLNVIKEFHGKNIILQKFEKENYTLAKSLINNMSNNFNEKFFSISVTTSRNFSGYQFSPKISRSERIDVETIFINLLRKYELDIFEESSKMTSLRKIKNYF